MKKLFGLAIVIILSYWTIRPLIGPGYFPMHDDTQVARVVTMGKALREGQFPVRWVSDLGYGYGYPIFNFYGPLPYYVGGFFYALGLTGLTATKIMMGVGMILAGVSMYIVVADALGISAGVLAAVFYMFAPYHAVDAYVRGAVGEYWALSFLPLICWGFVRKKTLTGALGIAGLVLSHTILGFAGMLFLSVAAIITRLHKPVLVMMILGLGLSAFFWLPAAAEMSYTNVSSVIGKSSADFSDHFVCFPQLWNSLWGYGGSAAGCLDGFSFKIGKEHLVIGFISLLGIWSFIKYKTAKYLTGAGFMVLIASVLFMVPVSKPVWSFIPYFAYVQYPWRFLSFAVFGVSLMIAGLPVLFSNKVVRYIVVAFCVVLVITVEAKRFMPQYTYVRPAASFETDEDIQFRASKVSDEYLPPEVFRPTAPDMIPPSVVMATDTINVKIVENFDTYKKFQFTSETGSRVKVNVAEFPGWAYMVNDDMVKPESENGLPVLTIPNGFTVVQMWFRNTPIRSIGNTISLVSLCVVLYMYDKQKKTIS